MDHAVIHNRDALGKMPLANATAWMVARDAVERIRSHEGSDFLDDEINAYRIVAEGSTGGAADDVMDVYAVCREYLNDPWSRYGSRSGPHHERNRQPDP